jgi:asparagine synthase (glutamine-hydrolysing)
MLAGVEARVPFLDYKLVEFSYQKIPYDLKLKWKNDEAYKKAMHLSSDEFSEILDIPKYLLKKIAYEYLPREVIERKKMGFPVPLNHWLNSLENNAKNLLKDAYWIKPNTVDELLTESKKNPRTGQIIWMLINVELFRLKYFE